jgi:protein-S-isoprenylcysteine O-methyltransferase Ste14
MVPGRMIFDDAFWRFATSGTLLGLYGLTEVVARRAGAGDDRPGVPPPGWLKPASWIFITAFYLLIQPTGGALAGGAGNLAGIVLALVAMGLRYEVRNGVPGVRHPATATRLLFYTALPLAVGVPWGWLALSLPALLMSAHCAIREDKILVERLGEPHRVRVATTRRWIPGVW